MHVILQPDASSDIDNVKQICGTVKFIPDRPRELVSGGYDTAILHFDFLQGNLLSRRDIRKLVRPSPRL